MQDKPAEFPPSEHFHYISDIYFLEDTVNGLVEAIGFKQGMWQKGQPYGYAELDEGGKVPLGQLPDGLGGPTAWDDIPDRPTEFPPEAHTHDIADVTGLQDALDGKQDSLGFTPEDAAQKGQANGYAGLDGTGKVPAAQLPAYVDDVLEATDLASLPVSGETGKIYVTLDTNKTWRWSGSAYVEISPSPGSTDSVTEGSVNLYHTPARVRATDLTGYDLALSRQALAAGDTILGAFGKIGKWLADLAGVAFSGSASDLGTGTLPIARIANSAVTNAKLAQVATATIKGRATAGTGDPEDLTPTKAWDVIDDAALNTAQNWTKAQGSTPVALTDGANIATDASLSNVFTVTLGGNRTLDNPSNVVAGRTYAWIITQDGTGSRTLAFGSAFEFPGGTDPTLSTGGANVDLITGIAISSSRILCVANLKFS